MEYIIRDGEYQDSDTVTALQKNNLCILYATTLIFSLFPYCSPNTSYKTVCYKVTKIFLAGSCYTLGGHAIGTVAIPSVT